MYLRHLHGGVLCATTQGILPRTAIRTSLVLEGTEEGLT